jgi:dihydroorotate dehydrogenase (NAD+) catalytic subunit
MIIKGINFGNIFNASGARGFYGEGYPFHKLLKLSGLNFNGITFVSKTATLEPHKGNMNNKIFPKCIKVNFSKGIILNAVGLSNPGAIDVISSCMPINKPYMLSYMPVSNKQISETTNYAKIICASGIKNCGIQLNISCPNTNNNHNEILKNAHNLINCFNIIDNPLFIKLNALTPIEVALEISENKRCDGLICSNTIPWSQLPEWINWNKLFGTNVSPLTEFGGGGLSGAPLLPIVVDWIIRARAAGITKPIIGGGGILSKDNALEIMYAGANAIELGSIFILRPWRVKEVVKCVNNI